MWTTFKNWLTGNMGTPGEYAYQAMHVYSTLAVLLVMVVLAVLALRFRKNSKKSRLLLVAVAAFQLGFELLWRLIYLFVGGATLRSMWPMYPCNLGGILIPLIALLNLRRGKQLFYLFGFIGGCLTFAIPNGIFCNSIFVFPILKSVLQHTGLLIIPMLACISGDYRPTLRDMGWVTLGCVIHTVNCEGIDRLLGFTGDYMFFRSGLPFVIPGVSQFITLSVFALLVMALLSFVCDIPGSVAFLKGKGKGREKVR